MEENLESIWRYQRTQEGEDLTLFQARFDWYVNRRNEQRIRATVLDAPDWVNVVALTPEGEVVIVKQYRFGTRSVTSEIPAGIIEEDETSQAAARRELREETGYTSHSWTALGYVEPNPAFFNNKCYMWLARDAHPSHPPQLDVGENIHTVTLDRASLAKEIQEGRLRHSLAIAALSRVFPIWTLEGGK